MDSVLLFPLAAGRRRDPGGLRGRGITPGRASESLVRVEFWGHPQSFKVSRSGPQEPAFLTSSGWWESCWPRGPRPEASRDHTLYHRLLRARVPRRCRGGAPWASARGPRPPAGCRGHGLRAGGRCLLPRGSAHLRGPGVGAKTSGTEQPGWDARTVPQSGEAPREESKAGEMEHGGRSAGCLSASPSGRALRAEVWLEEWKIHRRLSVWEESQAGEQRAPRPSEGAQPHLSARGPAGEHPIAREREQGVKGEGEGQRLRWA